jgi:hypothetical protein
LTIDFGHKAYQFTFRFFNMNKILINHFTN